MRHSSRWLHCVALCGSVALTLGLATQPARCDEDWMTWESPEGRFVLDVPQPPEARVMQDHGATVHLFTMRDAIGCEYAIAYMDLPEAPADPGAKLDAMRANIRVKHGISEDFGPLALANVSRDGLPGRALRGSSATAKIEVRLYQDGARNYQLYAACLKSLGAAAGGDAAAAFEATANERQKYFASFKLRSHETVEK